MRDSVNSDFSEALQTASWIWIQRYSSSLQRCGDCGGYFRSSAAARVWCVYINFKRSKKTAPAAPALAGQQSFPTPTTTDHLHQSLKPQLARGRDQFFSQTYMYILHTHAKKQHPTGGVSPLFTAVPPQKITLRLSSRSSHPQPV